MAVAAFIAGILLMLITVTFATGHALYANGLIDGAAFGICITMLVALGRECP